MMGSFIPFVTWYRQLKAQLEILGMELFVASLRLPPSIDMAGKIA